MDKTGSNTGNKRDWSPEAKARREDRNIVMDFTGWFGLIRAQINHNIGTVFQKKPKRGWAAKRRAALFCNYLPPDKIEIAARRHKWRQKELAA
jgi:hypothetical protein